MMLTTHALPADSSLKSFAAKSWAEFARSRLEILSHTEPVEQTPALVRVDFREKLGDGMEWTGRAYFALLRPEQLGYRFCFYVRPSEVETVAPVFEKIITTCVFQDWHPLGQVDGHGNITDFANLNGTTLVTVGTAHGMVSVALSATDVKRLIGLLNSERPTRRRIGPTPSTNGWTCRRSIAKHCGRQPIAWTGNTEIA